VVPHVYLVMPRGSSETKYKHLLTGWEVLKSFKKGSRLFMAPDGKGGYDAMPPSPFPGTILYDPPRKPAVPTRVSDLW
jgi:hypothetical protein